MDINKIREDFPVLVNNKDICYLDSAATSLKPNIVLNKMDEYYKYYGVNVNRGVYKMSFDATNEYEETRKIVANFINANENEIVYTKGTTNGLNMVVSSFGDSIIHEGDEIITSELDHHSSSLPWYNLALKKHAKLIYIPLNEEGRITIENFKKVLTNKTKIVALPYVSNVMGYITPVKEIIKLSHEVGAKVIVDAAQGVPHLKIDVKELDCDFLAFSAHKMLGPTGFGILYGKYELLKKMSPVEFGGDMNDTVDLYEATYKEAPFKFEAGTPPIAEAIAFKEAIKYLNNIGFEFIQKQEKELMKYTINELKKIPNLDIYNPTSETGIISFNLKGVHPHDVATFYDQENICIRAGHHCAQLITKWLGCVGTLRVSFYFYNTLEDAKKFVEVTKQAAEYFKEWL